MRHNATSEFKRIYALDLPSFISEWDFGGILSNAPKGGEYRPTDRCLFFCVHEGPAMTWFIDTQQHYPIIAEIEKQTDRGAGIMAAALLEGYLITAIRTRLFVEGDYNEDVGKTFFADGGPLGSFIPRIHAGFCLAYIFMKPILTLTILD